MSDNSETTNHTQIIENLSKLAEQFSDCDKHEEIFNAFEQSIRELIVESNPHHDKHYASIKDMLDKLKQTWVDCNQSTVSTTMLINPIERIAALLSMLDDCDMVI